MAFDVGALTASLRLNDKQFTAGLDKAKRSLKVFNADVGRIGSSGVKAFRGITNSVFNLKTAIAGLGVGLLAGSFTKVASSMETFEVQLQTTLGSLGKAREELTWIGEFAKSTPFEVQELVKASVRIRAYGIDARKYMETLGDTASAMGKPMMQAVEALADAQTGEFERLKEFGLKVVQEGGQDLILYTDKFGKEQKAVIDRNNRELVTSTITSIWNEKYKGGMDRLSKTWGGMISNLADHWFQFRNTVMQSGLFQFMKEGLRTFLDWINRLKDEGQLDVWAKQISDSIINSLVVVGGIVAKFPGIWFEAISRIKTIFGFFTSAVDTLILAPIEAIMKAYNALPFIKDVSLSGIKGLRSALQDTAMEFIIQGDNLDKAGDKWREWGDKARDAINRVKTGITEVSQGTTVSETAGGMGGGVSAPSWLPGQSLATAGQAKEDTFVDDQGEGGSMVDIALAEYQARMDAEAEMRAERLAQIESELAWEEELERQKTETLIALQESEIKAKQKAIKAQQMVMKSIQTGLGYLAQAFPKMKGLQIAEAGIQFAGALMKALNVPWPASIGAYAQVLALGKKTLDMMGGGSPSQSSAPSIYEPPTRITGEEVGASGQSITFNINALDPESVDRGRMVDLVSSVLPEVLKSTGGQVGDINIQYEE